ncbi:outer membrane protein romA, partial [human gut metagenome]
RDRTGRVVCPLGVGEYFEYWGFDPQRITELDWGEQAALGGGFTVYCRPARHFSGRTFRANRTLWASFVVETPSQRIFLGGDGGYDTHFADVAREFPNLDVAVLEDGQYSEDWRYIHMLPADLKRAVEDLGARRVFPVHNSKYALARHPWDEPLNNAAALAAENPEAGIVLPRIGEPVRLDRSDTLPGRWWTAPEN